MDKKEKDAIETLEAMLGHSISQEEADQMLEAAEDMFGKKAKETEVFDSAAIKSRIAELKEDPLKAEVAYLREQVNALIDLHKRDFKQQMNRHPTTIEQDEASWLVYRRDKLKIP